MDRLNVVSGDAALLDRLRAAPLRGRVHSVFAHVVNVAPHDGGLLTLAARTLDDAPATLVIDAVRMDALGLAPGDIVASTPEGLQLGMRARVDCAGARRWHPDLPAFPADPARLRSNLATLAAGEACAHRVAAHASDASGASLARAATLRLAAEVEGLRRALLERDATDAMRHARELLGLGPGLTPSGDDVLAGLLAVLALRGNPCAPLRPLAVQIAAEARQRTNAISAAMLEAAARGAVRDSLQRLLHAMVSGDAATVRAAAARVLAIGASSGRDLLSGIVTGFECALEARRVAAPD
jgi:hypothetical protein